MVIHPCTVMTEGQCRDCEAMREHLAVEHAARAQAEQRIGTLEAERDALQLQLREALKLVELQKADLDRYRKVLEAREPHRPERVPPERMQLAFEQVLASFEEKPAANDDAASTPGDEGSATPPSQEGVPGAQPSGTPAPRVKRRHRHGRRPLNLANLPVVRVESDPEEVTAAGGEGFVHIGDEISSRVAFRRASYIRMLVVRRKWVRAKERLAVVSESGSPDNTSEPSGSEETSASRCEDDGPEVTLLPAEDDDVVAGDVAAEDEAAGTALVVPDCDAAVAGARVGGVTAPSAEASVCGTGVTGEEEPPGPVLIGPIPDGVWPNVMADPSAIAEHIVAKYDDSLPLNRQERITARHGFRVPRSTQCSWLGAAYAFLYRIVEAMFAEGKAGAFCIATDATGARVRARGRAECEDWHIFVFIADNGHVVFRYTKEQTGEAVQAMLRGFHGHLLADAATIYDILFREDGMTEVGCWQHLRRYVWKALLSEPKRALAFLAIVGKLFEIDRTYRDLALPERTTARARDARPILDLLDKWIDREKPTIDPRSPLDAAITYYKNQRTALSQFLEDGRLRLDNNISEGALRAVVLGLLNFTFFANETGLKWYSVFRSLIASCRMHDLNVQDYLEQVLRLAPHWPVNRVIELSPKYWLETLAHLDARQQRIIARPWELEPASPRSAPDLADVA